MATKQDKTKISPDQNPPTDNTTARGARGPDAADSAQTAALPDAVAEAIDTERVRLS